MKFDISVTTEIWRHERSGRSFLYFDAGTMRWFRCDDEVKRWLAESCRVTAMDLMTLPQSTAPVSYSVRYRTIVRESAPSTHDGRLVSDTTMLEFDGLTYADMTRFQRWALEQLREMVDLFERRHGQRVEPVRRRSRVRTVASLAWQWMRGGVSPAAPDGERCRDS